MFIVISDSTQVLLKGYDDKRQMMVLLEIVRNGYILPPQLLCQGKTEKWHPKFGFPEYYDVFHSEKKNPTDLSLWQKGLCILDVFAAHRSNELLNVMAIKNMSCVRQHKLQPFKIILKKIFERNIKNEFQQYCAH